MLSLTIERDEGAAQDPARFPIIVLVVREQQRCLRMGEGLVGFAQREMRFRCMTELIGLR